MTASNAKSIPETEDRYKETLLNILPDYIADELIRKKSVHPKVFRHTTILFTDVVKFSRLAVHLDPVTLIRRLNSYVTLHDRIMDEFGKSRRLVIPIWACRAFPTRRAPMPWTAVWQP
jgi:class 3 adenylate cyclase